MIIKTTLKTYIKFLINNIKACVKHVSYRLVIYIKTYIKILLYIFIPIINKTTITINYLKNIYILLLCVNFIFIDIHAQKNIEGCEWKEYFFEEGNLSSEGCLINGIPEGIWKSYFIDGNLKSKGLRKENKLEGIWKFYRKNSKLENEISYNNDKKNGRDITYYENGNILSITNWKSNIKEGLEYYYFPSGKIQFQIVLEENKKHGKSIEYAEDGRKIGFTTYKKGLIVSIEKFNRFNNKGEKTGVWKEFHLNETIKEEGPFSNNKKHGVFRLYNQRGDIQDIIYYEFGIIVNNENELIKTEVIRIYDVNGKLENETAYKNGLKNGVSRIYDNKGNIISGNIFKEGEIISKGITDKSGKEQDNWEFYYPDGSVKAEGKYKNGLRIGKWIFYNNKGWIEQTGSYINGELDGKWLWMDKNGFIIRLEEYNKGLEDGEFKEYGIEKKVILNGLYKNGMRVGFWIYHVNDHIEEGNYLNGEFNGKWVHWYSDETKMFEGDYSYGQPEGTHKFWYPDGKIKISGKYNGGAKHGKWRYFLSNGDLDYIHLFKHDKLWKVDGRRVARNRDSSRH